MKNQHQFRQLLQEFAKATELASPEFFIATGLVKVDGMPMLVHYDQEKMPGKMLLRMDLGPVQGDKPRTWFNLLAGNYALGELGFYVFSINPESGNIMLTLQLDLDDKMTAQQLFVFMRTAVQEGKRCWDHIRKIVDNPDQNVVDIMAAVRPDALSPNT